MKLKDSKIHAICVVKNEVDIIGHCLAEASKWADHVYVYDGESTDGTWEKVLAMQNDTIVPWKQDGKTFQESLRGEVFNAFKHIAQPGDWWCHLDADEFYIQFPRDFLASVKPYIHVVWGIAIEYYLSQSDVDTLDFSKPASELLPALRLYKAENSEPRFFRHRDGLIWDNGSWPKHIGVTNAERILYKHYKYRNPEQIQLRLDTRRKNREGGFPGWEHASEDDWRTKLVHSKDLNYDAQDGQYYLDLEKLPNHLESLPKRILKRVMHGTGIWA